MANEIQIPGLETGLNHYAILTNGAQVWNGAALENENASNWTSYDIALTESAVVTGLYRGTFPAAAPAGVYSVLVYERAGVAPTTTDELVAIGEIIWNGAAVVSELTTLDAVAEVPTNAEFEARTLPSGDYATPADVDVDVTVDGGFSAGDATNLADALTAAQAAQTAAEGAQTNTAELPALIEAGAFTEAALANTPAGEATLDEDVLADIASIKAKTDLITANGTSIVQGPYATNEDITRTAGDTWTITIEGIDSLDGADVEFAIKDKRGTSDDNAYLRVRSDDGLVRLMKADAAASSNKGAITLDEDEGTATITVDETITAQMAMSKTGEWFLKRFVNNEAVEVAYGNFTLNGPGIIASS